MTKIALSGLYAPPDEPWLALHSEAVIDPARPIVDAHHHLWDGGRPRYLIDEILADTASGHNVVATVYVDCRSMYRASGPDHLRPTGEIEFARGVAAMSASGGYGDTRLCAAIVGFADLRAGDHARQALEALMAAGGDRFRGIRQVSAWDADPEIIKPIPNRPERLLGDASFRRGFACLAPLGLTFDAFLLHPQIPELTDLARAFPDTPIVLDHVGMPLGIGRYRQHREVVFRDWHASIRELARCENVCIKLGGLGMQAAGFDFREKAEPPTSVQLAAAWRPFIEAAIEAFGPARSMFESNFPPDKGTCSYQVLWNAFKILAGSYSEDEKTAMFSGTASRIYHIAADPR